MKFLGLEIKRAGKPVSSEKPIVDAKAEKAAVSEAEIKVSEAEKSVQAAILELEVAVKAYEAKAGITPEKISELHNKIRERYENINEALKFSGIAIPTTIFLVGMIGTIATSDGTIMTSAFAASVPSGVIWGLVKIAVKLKEKFEMDKLYNLPTKTI